MIKGVSAVMCVTALALLTFGFVMLASTSSFSGFRGDAFYFAKRQALWMVLGLMACAVAAHTNYRLYRKLAWPLFLGTVVLLAGLLVFGRPINGAKRWFIVGPIQFQPSELAKYALIMVLAFWLERMQRARKGQLQPRIERWRWGVFAPMALMGVPALLILLEPDLGTALLLGALALVLMWVAGAPARWLMGIVSAAGFGLAAFLVAIFRFNMFHGSYQVRRILDWWYGTNLQGSNYQQEMAKLAFGSGGPWGLGLGNSRQKMDYLPEAHTDFIFPIIGEELGLVATLSVVLAFGVLIWCGLLIARRATSLFGVLLGTGIVTVIGLQVMINIAVVTNTIPNKGMPLPFISYGGSNLVMTLASLGVLLNIFRQAQVPALDEAVDPSHRPLPQPC